MELNDRARAHRFGYGGTGSWYEGSWDHFSFPLPFLLFLMEDGRSSSKEFLLFSEKSFFLFGKIGDGRLKKICEFLFIYICFCTKNLKIEKERKRNKFE